jgi:hypothetical protein
MTVVLVLIGVEVSLFAAFLPGLPSTVYRRLFPGTERPKLRASHSPNTLSSPPPFHMDVGTRETLRIHIDIFLPNLGESRRNVADPS